MGKNKTTPGVMVVPLEFGLNSDGTMRMIVHLTDITTLPQVLTDIGNHVPEIIDAFTQQLEEFVKEKEAANG